MHTYLLWLMAFLFSGNPSYVLDAGQEIASLIGGHANPGCSFPCCVEKMLLALVKPANSSSHACTGERIEVFN